MTKSIIIVDLDGTICDSSARLEAIGFDPTKPIEEWPKYWGDHSKDPQIPDMVKLVKCLFEKYEIWIVTIRNGEPEHRVATEEWLNRRDIPYEKLYTLGREGIKQPPPAEIKRNWLYSLLPEERENILFAMDDSPSMLAMFKEEGIKTLDVGQFAGSM